MSFSKIVLGTKNPGKVDELKQGMRELNLQGVKIFSLSEIGFEKDVEESGKTFVDNARIKAEFYSRALNLPVVGDDGGLVIPALNNEPGVYSRRWLGYEASDEELIRFTLQKMKKLKGGERKAFLKVVLYFYWNASKDSFWVEEEVEGYIREKPMKERFKGYPFRSLFIVKKFKKPYYKLTQKENEMINHRIKASKQITRLIIKRYFH